MHNELPERSASGDRPSSRYLARVALVLGLLTLAVLSHAAVLYLALVGPLPAVTIAVAPLGLVVLGIVGLFRQSWRGGRTIAGRLTAVATIALALAFVTGAYRGQAPGDAAPRFVVDAISIPNAPTIAGLTVGFELGSGQASVAQFLLPVVVGYLFLTGALWTHPGVAALGTRLAGKR